jgi:hypothetical protein
MKNNKEQSFPTYYLLGILSEMRIGTYSKTLIKEALQFHKLMGFFGRQYIMAITRNWYNRKQQISPTHQHLGALPKSYDICFSERKQKSLPALTGFHKRHAYRGQSHGYLQPTSGWLLSHHR